MASQSKVDKAIVRTVAEHGGPITLKNIMYQLERSNLHEGRSFRTVSDRVYALRRDGVLLQVGQGQNARYELGEATKEKITERAQQNEETRRREQQEQPDQHEQENTNTTPSAATAGATSTTERSPEKLGPCTAVHMGSCWVITPVGNSAQPLPEPASPTPPASI